MPKEWVELGHGINGSCANGIYICPGQRCNGVPQSFHELDIWKPERTAVHQQNLDVD